MNANEPGGTVIITLIKIAHIHSSSVLFFLSGTMIYLANSTLLVQSVDIWCFIVREIKNKIFDINELSH